VRSPSATMPREIHPASRHPVLQDHWIDFNRKLSMDARRLPNEASIESRLDTIREMEIGDLRVFWLTVARIAELAIKQAGDYADNCEFLAAGDLLANPRRIDVYRRGRTTPVVKDRHRGLSFQFAAAIGNNNPVVWLSRETLPDIREEALLPHLRQMLASGGYMTLGYLADLDRRMSRVADTIAFLMAWPVANSVQLYRRMQRAGPEEEAFIQRHLCCFDWGRFNTMGADIEKMAMNGGCLTRFLSNPTCNDPVDPMINKQSSRGCTPAI
jgi:hypothetical protein